MKEENRLSALVALQVPHEMPGSVHPLEVRRFRFPLLYPILTEVLHAEIERLANAVGGNALRDADQGDVGGAPT